MRLLASKGMNNARWRALFMKLRRESVESAARAVRNGRLTPEQYWTYCDVAGDRFTPSWRLARHSSPGATAGAIRARSRFFMNNAR